MRPVTIAVGWVIFQKEKKEENKSIKQTGFSWF
jgi:hypothetical protein